MNLTQKSKHLSYVLRHRPDKAGLTLDENGWTDVDKLMSGLDLTREELEHVVENNNKKRFEFSESGDKIRARQGHSVDVDLKYEEKIPPAFLFHGTTEKPLGAIQRDGLLKMKRHHVHLSLDEATAIIVGKRRGKPVVLKVRAGDMYWEGYKFYLSNNNVWLTDHVPPKYLEEMT